MTLETLLVSFDLVTDTRKADAVTIVRRHAQTERRRVYSLVLSHAMNMSLHKDEVHTMPDDTGKATRREVRNTS